MSVELTDGRVAWLALQPQSRRASKLTWRAQTRSLDKGSRLMESCYVKQGGCESVSPKLKRLGPSSQQEVCVSVRANLSDAPWLTGTSGSVPPIYQVTSPPRARIARFVHVPPQFSTAFLVEKPPTTVAALVHISEIARLTSPTGFARCSS